MISPERPSDPQRMARHREELQLALVERLPLTSARQICQDRRRQARARPIPASPTSPPATALVSEQVPAFWWMRD